MVIESNDLKTETFVDVFRAFPEQFDVMMAFHHANVSMSRYGKFRHLAERLGRGGDDAFVEEMATAFSRRMTVRAAECPFVPGALDFLCAFAGRLPLYVVSMTPQPELDDIVERRGLAAYFRRTYGCPPWTKSAAIGEIAGRIGRDEVIFVGDSAADQRAAREAGIAFVGRDSGLAFDEPRPATVSDLHALAAALQTRAAC